MTKRGPIGPPLAFVVFLAAAVFSWFPPCAAADQLDDEFRFASGLIELGFPDYADKVVQQVLRLHPDQKDRAKLIQAEILISRRKFADAEAIVKTMPSDSPKAQAITLVLAKGYHLMGDTEKAKQLYNDFFKLYEGRTPTDPDLLRFYQDSAYQFGQMLEAAGDKAGAVKAYGRILATKPDRNTMRRIQADQAELYVKIAADSPDQREMFLGEAKKLCDAIQWGGMDIWFGQSIMTLAHMEMVRGNKDAAAKVLQGNMDILKEIDTYLKDQGLPLSVSPMAGARFLLGQLYQQQAESLAKIQNQRDAAVASYGKALAEFINVFAKYADSDWGPQAGVRAQQIKATLEQQYGKKVNWELGAFSTQAAEAQFRLADNLFRQKQYKSAIDEYLKNLNQFPETEATPPALANVALSYTELGDKLMVKMVSEYLGERFAGKEGAALALLGIGKAYFDRKDEPMYVYEYETYLKHFPKHNRAAAILFILAGMRKQAGDLAGAAKYYQQIVEKYPKDQYYPKALSQMAWGYYASSNWEGAIKGFISYVAEAQPGPDKAQGQFALADSYRRLDKLPEALAEYEKLIQWLAPKETPFSTSAADAQKNADVLERAAFQRGYCLARMKQPPEAVPGYRTNAIKAYDQFLALFPQSRLAPEALNGKGTAQLELGQFDAAAKTFDEVAARYPQSDQGRNALFSLVRSAMEIKQYDQARSAFAKMMTSPGTYTADQFVRLGQMMLDAGQYAEAAQAFQQVTASSQERNQLERSLYGVGKAQFELKNYIESIRSLEDLMGRYPKSGLFYDAKFTLGNAYREVGDTTNALLALGDVMKYADKPVLINQASYELGLIQKQQGDNTGALASFLRVALLADPKKPELRPYIEKSILEGIKLAMDMLRYQDVQDLCDQYLKVFPDSDKIETIRKYKADAKMKATASPPPAQPAAPTPEQQPKQP
ncbi:MAG: tetratricopeptide repeat protein [Verrucomicrobiota bacterium]